jgi:archaemetzincin
MDELERLRSLLESRFQTKVGIGGPQLDHKSFYDDKRLQYYSSAILEFLEKNMPPSSEKVLAITGLDLFIPILTFVFGEAMLGGSCAIASSFRLDNAYYGLPENPALLEDRLFKEAIHELGHTYGLVHCRNPYCVMTSSTYVEEIDLKKNEFCGTCVDNLKRKK